MKLLSTTNHGIVEWRWKKEKTEDAKEDRTSPFYKSLHYQWWIPKKSDFEIVTDLDRQTKQEVKDEIWEDLQNEINYIKNLYKLHKKTKREESSESV